MNWKEFFKPDWKKTAVFVIILILLFKSIEDFISNSTMLCWIPEGCPPSPVEGKVRLFGVYIDSTILRIAFYISFYILSCLIIWIYNKVRKK